MTVLTILPIGDNKYLDHIGERVVNAIPSIRGYNIAEKIDPLEGWLMPDQDRLTLDRNKVLRFLRTTKTPVLGISPNYDLFSNASPGNAIPELRIAYVSTGGEAFNQLEEKFNKRLTTYIALHEVAHLFGITGVEAHHPEEFLTETGSCPMFPIPYKWLIDKDIKANLFLGETFCNVCQYKLESEALLSL